MNIIINNTNFLITPRFESRNQITITQTKERIWNLIKCLNRVKTNKEIETQSNQNQVVFWKTQRGKSGFRVKERNPTSNNGKIKEGLKCRIKNLEEKKAVRDQSDGLKKMSEKN